MQEETDIVLSAIRRGVDSRPGLHSETGIDYSRLDVVLHNLEFEWRAIDKRETADGFDRFSARAGEKLGHIDISETPAPVAEPNGNAPKFSVATAVRNIVADWPAGTDVSQPLVTQRILRDHPEIAPYIEKLQVKAQVAGALTRLFNRNRLRLKQKGQGSEPSIFVKEASDSEDSTQDVARTFAETVAKVQEMLGAAPEAVKEAILDADAAVVAAIAPEFERDAFCLRNCDPGGIGHHYKCSYFPVNHPHLSPVGDKITARSHCEVTVDGKLQFNIEVNIAFDELATWSPMRISRFFEGIAKVVKAGE